MPLFSHLTDFISLTVSKIPIVGTLKVTILYNAVYPQHNPSHLTPSCHIYLRQIQSLRSDKKLITRTFLPCIVTQDTSHIALVILRPAIILPPKNLLTFISLSAFVRKHLPVTISRVMNMLRNNYYFSFGSYHSQTMCSEL